MRQAGGEATARAERAAGRQELPAELLRRLEFKVLRRLDGILFGEQTGFFYGPSLDLAEVREYQPGDEVRRIDWNVTARSGALHVRQYREVIAYLVVDRSDSMAFGTRRVLKRELALEFAGVAAAALVRSGKVGALSFAPAGMRLTKLGGGRRQALTILDDLMAPLADRTRPLREGSASPREGVADLSSALERLHRVVRRRALVFVVSDFLDPEPAGHDPSWRRALTLLAQRHDVIAVRVRDPAELALPQVGDLRVRDLETGEELWCDTADPRVRREHARLVEERERMLERSFRAAGVDLLELSTDRDVLAPLLRFIRQRRGRRS